jgi:cyclic pyranopterin phosphate synthase
MSCSEICQLSRIMALNGIKVMRLTGGEPMNRPDIIDIVRCIKNIPGIESVQMVTRSERFGNNAQTLKDVGLDSVTFSLDAMDEVLFSKISGVGIGFHKAYIKSIRQAAQAGIPVRINVVVMKGINEGEIEKILNFAGEVQCNVKLLDLMEMGNEEFWRRHYLPFDELIGMLENRAVEVSTATAPGGLGTPMPKFLMPNGVAIYVKYACVGAWYGDVCQLCPMYPCQDAIMAVRITADGKLKRCLIRDDNLVDLLSMVQKGTSETRINAAVKKVLFTFMNARYQAGAWKPELSDEYVYTNFLTFGAIFESWI